MQPRSSIRCCGISTCSFTLARHRAHLVAKNLPMDRRSAVAGSSGAARPRPGCGAGIVFPIPRLCSTILSQIPKLGASRVFKAGWQLKHSPAACGASGTERACTKPRQWRRSTSGCFSEVRPSVRSLSVPVRSMHALPRMQLRTRRRYSLVATQETERTLSLVLATSLRVAIAAT